MPKFDPLERSILYGYRGSISHGTRIPKQDPHSVDDIDVMGICVSPISYYFGLERFEQQEKFEGDLDSVIYDIRKMFRMLLKSNPNVCSFVWMKPDMYMKTDELGQLILDNREIFSSQRAFYSFTGYARAQLRETNKSVFQGYMGSKRKAMVEEFGYDVKHMGHCIRLLRMGTEFIETGVMLVDRTDIDAQELIDIKLGKYKFEELKEEAERLFTRAEKAKENTPLPEEPDYDRANELLIDIVSTYTNRDK